MGKLTWDKVGERLYETGIDQGVLYPQDENGAYPLGVAWNGLSNVTEKPSGAEPSPVYADNTKYLDLMSAEEFGASVEAYMYPDEFKPCNGEVEVAPGVYASQQNRTPFGMSYRTLIGNDVKNNDYGYKLHLIYGAKATPSEKNYQSVNESPDIAAFSWDITTTPVSIEGFKPTAQLTIDSTKTDAAKLAALEEILYGNETTDARLPLPDEVITIIGTQG